MNEKNERSKWDVILIMLINLSGKGRLLGNGRYCETYWNDVAILLIACRKSVQGKCASRRRTPPVCN